MNNDEKRDLAVDRELEELRKCVESFDEVVESARRLAQDCRDSLARFRSIERDAIIDEKIDDLDRLTGRGKYRPALVQAAENVQDFGDLAVAIARTYAPNVHPIKRP